MGCADWEQWCFGIKDTLFNGAAVEAPLWPRTFTRALDQRLENKPRGLTSDSERDQLFKKSHYNLLFSLDHSKKGFFEGFGLSCLEAAKFGVPSIVLNSGGLSENVHHKFNGLVLNSLEEAPKIMFDTNFYRQCAQNSYDHVYGNHHLGFYKKALEVLCRK